MPQSFLDEFSIRYVNKARDDTGERPIRSEERYRVDEQPAQFAVRLRDAQHDFALRLTRKCGLGARPLVDGDLRSVLTQPRREVARVHEQQLLSAATEDLRGCTVGVDDLSARFEDQHARA